MITRIRKVGVACDRCKRSPENLPYMNAKLRLPNFIDEDETARWIEDNDSDFLEGHMFDGCTRVSTIFHKTKFTSKLYCLSCVDAMIEESRYPRKDAEQDVRVNS